MRRKKRSRPAGHDNERLGVMNAAALATLYDASGTAIGYCMDTPNALAFGFAETGADFAQSVFGTVLRTDAVVADRIKHKGWMTPEKALFSRSKPVIKRGVQGNDKQRS